MEFSYVSIWYSVNFYMFVYLKYDMGTSKLRFIFGKGLYEA